MKFIKTLLKSWIFRLCLMVVCGIVAFIDIHYDLTEFGILSLIAVILGIIAFIAFLTTRSSNDNGIKRLLTMVICTGALGISILLLGGINLFYYWDIEIFAAISRILFFVSGTVLLLRLVWRKK